MRKRAAMLLVLTAGLFGGIIAIGLRRAAPEHFGMHAPLIHRPEMELTGITAQIETSDGPMVVSAGRAGVGYEHLGHLRLGIGSHLILREVVVDGPSRASAPWSLRAREAKWMPTKLVPVGRTMGRLDGAEPEVLRDVAIDLRSGSLTTGGERWP